MIAEEYDDKPSNLTTEACLQWGFKNVGQIWIYYNF